MSSETRSVSFDSAGQPPIRLEGRLHLPATGAFSSAAIIAHPHPQWGGTMASGVVVQIAQTLAQRGCAALRFNFRGVGQGKGSYGDGCGEVDDVIGALDYLASLSGRADEGRLAVVGYSFGAWVATRAALSDERVRVCAAVALPMSAAYAVDLSTYAHPKCFITGAGDTICPPELLRQYVGTLPEPKTLHVIPGTDHFLLRHEQDVADRVADCVLSAIG
jgi:alpha/beta superfamily hydrolase